MPLQLDADPPEPYFWLRGVGPRSVGRSPESAGLGGSRRPFLARGHVAFCRFSRGKLGLCALSNQFALYLVPAQDPSNGLALGPKAPQERNPQKIQIHVENR